MSIKQGGNLIAGSTCSRNIGEIVASTIPLSDAGLHLLDGSLISSAGSYAKFVNYIAGLVSNYPDLFTTEANWQSSVSTYGVCGKFVYDSVNNTVRLPKITGFTEGTTDVTALGDLVEAGLPNITGGSKPGYIGGTTWPLVIDNTTGAFYSSSTSTSSYSTTLGSNLTNGLDFDASRSNSIYGNSTTVQPQSIKVLYYIVIASSITNELNLDVADMATKSLDNLDNTGKNIANWSNNVTNCITEIPQDIKLELNDGTLTLKAGSKVYVPNGFESDGTTPKFDTVILQNDKIYNTVTSTTGRSMFFLYPSLNIGAYSGPDDAIHNYYFSGPTAPTVTLTYALWYDTTNNIVKHTSDNGVTWTSGDSLPLSICSYTSGTGVTSIDQVFNGFGYIGSTWFLLPNVKFNVTWKRNDDGSYKTYIITNPSIKTLTRTSGALSNWTICTSIYNYEVYDIHYEYDSYIVNNLPTSGTIYTSYFNLQDGMQYYTSSGTTPNYSSTVRVKLVENTSCDSSGKITASGKFLLPFTRVLSINDSSTISGWSMPSSRYIDLTLGASGSTYTAPANGYYTWQINSTAANQYFGMQNTTSEYIQAFQWVPISGGGCHGFISARTGDVCVAHYTASNAILFRFIYAQGDS